jgi:hypothetical protein
MRVTRPAAAPNMRQTLDERNPPRRGDVCVDFVGLVYVARLDEHLTKMTRAGEVEVDRRLISRSEYKSRNALGISLVRDLTIGVMNAESGKDCRLHRIPSICRSEFH